jgi:hypothetical protein
MLLECASPPGTVIVSPPRGPRKRRPRRAVEQYSGPEKPPYDTHEERASAAWHIFCKDKAKAAPPERRMERDAARRAV